MSELKNKDKQYVANTYARFPVEITHGKGSLVYDENGKEYIDLTSGIGVTSFGIADNEWIHAVTDQLGKVQHTSNLYYTNPCVELAGLLCEKTGFKKVFFSNSGAEANECAVKVARKYAASCKGNNHYTVITLENSFHGRTLTTLAATGQEHYHELFQPLTPGFIHVPANDISAIKHAVDQNKVAAIMLECVQGEGGVISLEADYIKAVAELANKENIVLIIDEVQTGNGRTGELYAYMNFGIMPDIITTAKGLGGGLPIGATLLSEKVEGVLGFGDHGSTYGANPVCCAGAISVIKRLDVSFLNEVKRKGELVRKMLKNAAGVKSVSGLGMMIGIETERKVSDIVKECIENGVLCLTAKTKIRLLPALNIPDEILIKSVEIIKESAARKDFE